MPHCRWLHHDDVTRFARGRHATCGRTLAPELGAEVRDAEFGIHVRLSGVATLMFLLLLLLPPPLAATFLLAAAAALAGRRHRVVVVVITVESRCTRRHR